MTWNISSEAISGIIVLIILIYSHNGALLPTLKNKMYQLCLWGTLGSITFNILSTLLIYEYARLPGLLVELVTLVYFIFTPLMGALYFFYATAVVFEGDRTKKAYPFLVVSGALCVAYLFFVAISPFTGALFSVRPGVGYQQGPYIAVTYIVFYAYCLLTLLVVLYRRRHIDAATQRILLSFPLLAVVVILIQQFFPTYILTGSAACCALLIIYLYLQNKQLTRDALTGLSNRQEFSKALHLRLGQKEKPFVVFIISLNDFKSLNDKVGHENGDLFLREVAAYLKGVVSFPFLYRYSGDEFAIISNLDRPKATALLDVLTARFAAPWHVKDFDFIIPAAMGVAAYPYTASDMDGLVSGLEFALEEAKARPSRYCFCSTEMMGQVQRKKEVEEVARTAFEKGAFSIHLQPIFSVSQGRFLFAESLLRLQDTPLGPIPPDEFIPLLEKNGLIIELTYWIIDQVCQVIRRWLDAGISFNGIAINFSTLQFLQEDLEQRILQIAQRHDVPLSKLKFEVTEGMLITNYTKVKTFIERMNALGARFGLDDFGTGYSNLASVMQLPFDTIKLDKSLVWDAMENSRSAALVRHLAGAFREQGVSVLAEGVETAGQLSFLTACGCEYIQGYYYARPMPVEEAAPYFRAPAPSAAHAPKEANYETTL